MISGKVLAEPLDKGQQVDNDSPESFWLICENYLYVTLPNLVI
jgi:hypothetical protein